MAPPTAGSPIDAKKRCRRAYDQARKVDAASGALLDRWWADTLLAVEGQPTAARDVMLTRTAILFEIMSDRRGWPSRIRGM
jgi:hypothetical protein